tara:strand:+ start:173 stop:472 length:300 start_codon:yes stop_codon:yes gene_type:complete
VKKVEELAEKAIKNIEADRKSTETLLKDLEQQLSTGQYTHVEVGTIAAKFLETLQRSNEQLVKLVGILSKQKDTASNFKLDDAEKENLFDMIEGGSGND